MNQISPRDATRAANYVLAQLNYTRAGGGKPAVYMYERPAGVPSIEERNEPHQVAIHSARPLLETLSLDLQGFELAHGTSAVTDFDDAAARVVELGQHIIGRPGRVPRTDLVHDTSHSKPGTAKRCGGCAARLLSS